MITHRADYFGLLSSEAECWSCKRRTPVVAILLDSFEVEPDEEGDEAEA